jgi:hypothetical protein
LGLSNEKQIQNYKDVCLGGRKYGAILTNINEFMVIIKK